MHTQAVLIAMGVNEEGHQEVLSLMLGDRESETSWSKLFIKSRGVVGCIW